MLTDCTTLSCPCRRRSAPGERRICPNTCGVICLTLTVSVAARASGAQPRQQIGEPAEIVVAEIGPARADHHGRIVGNDIGPLARKPGEVPRVVVEVDAVLAPRLPAIDQLKGPATQRMKGMGYSEGLYLTARMRCNRLLTPIRSSNA
jgi:hypothetical protein